MEIMLHIEVKLRRENQKCRYMPSHLREAASTVCTPFEEDHGGGP
jgi:hypothetical protein